MDPVIIDQFKIFHYSLALNKPLYVRGAMVDKREGYLVRIAANGHAGYGDVAPLEGLSKETMSECLGQLKRLQSGLSGAEIPHGLEKLDGGFKRWLHAHPLSSSVQFGLEQAVLDLMADARSIPMCQLISTTSYPEIAINGFLQGTKEEVKAQARELIDAGYHALKLKVDDDVDAAIEKVLAINAIIEGKAVLHIDANQSWTMAQAVHFGHEVGLTTVDYIEEPFTSTKDISDFFMKTTIPIALDETLLSQSIDKFKMIDGLEYLIIKPTVLGGLEASYQIIHQAHSAGLSTVLSSCYESSVGICALAHLAAATCRHQGSGLDTLKWFKNDVLKQPISIEHGKMKVRERSIDEGNINFEILTEIDA